MFLTPIPLSVGSAIWAGAKKTCWRLTYRIYYLKTKNNVVKKKERKKSIENFIDRTAFSVDVTGFPQNQSINFDAGLVLQKPSPLLSETEALSFFCTKRRAWFWKVRIRKPALALQYLEYYPLAYVVNVVQNYDCSTWSLEAVQ